MIIETNSETYWRIRDRWLSTEQPWLRALADEEVSRAFNNFLYAHGARLDHSQRDRAALHICDSVGCIPGVTRIVFDSEPAYTWFLLKCA